MKTIYQTNVLLRIEGFSPPTGHRPRYPPNGAPPGELPPGIAGGGFLGASIWLVVAKYHLAPRNLAPAMWAVSRTMYLFNNFIPYILIIIILRYSIFITK